MSKLRAALGLLLLAGWGLLAGCGVPGKTRPVVVTDAPRLGAQNDANPEPPPGPEGAGTPLELVKRFLAAPAWGNEVTEDRPNAFNDAVNKVRQFMVDDKRSSWQLTNKNPVLSVVRVVDTGPPVPASGGEVKLTLLPLGVLGDNGKFEPKLADTTQTPKRADITQSRTFIVKQVAGGGLRIDNPPTDTLLLSDEALRDWYEQHPIYFWDSEDKLLVPDLRYLPKVVPGAKRPTEIVDWLLDGPSTWLNGSVIPVNPVNKGNKQIERQDKLFVENGKLVVNLTAKAASISPVALGRFVHQLRWSLRPLEEPVELRIGGNQLAEPVSGSADGYLAFNPSGPPNALPEPDAFLVVDRRVQAVRGSAERAAPVLIPEQNVGVVSGALTRDKAALARLDGNRQRLFLGRFDADQGSATYRDTGLVGATLSRPAWLSLAGQRVLVAADGKLFDVSFPGGAFRMVDMGALRSVTAFAVAPDGRRIALVSGNEVYLAQLLPDGTRLRVGQPHRVSTRPSSEPAELDKVTGVAWSREDWIVVAGHTAAGGALVEVTVDGSRAERMVLTALDRLTVTGVVAQPQSPVNGSPGFVMIETTDGVYKIFSRDVGRLWPGSASAPPTAKPPGSQPIASAPFYLG